MHVRSFVHGPCVQLRPRSMYGIDQLAVDRDGLVVKRELIGLHRASYGATKTRRRNHCQHRRRPCGDPDLATGYAAEAGNTVVDKRADHGRGFLAMALDHIGDSPFQIAPLEIDVEVGVGPHLEHFRQ